MKELFGIPMGTLMLVLAVLTAAAAGAIGVLAARNRVFLKLGVRNLGRRRARSALIVVGLMLGTTIIAAALATGDTMSHTIRSTATRQLGETDEVVSAKGAAQNIPGELGQATGAGYFDQATVAKVKAALAGSSLVDGVAGAIIEEVALQAPVQRQTEPSVTLFAPDPSQLSGFAAIHAGGGTASLTDLGPREVYLNRKGADALHVQSGSPLLVYAGTERVRVTIRDVVRFDGAGTADSALLLPLGAAQRLYGKEGLVKHILKPTIAPLGLETVTAKADAIELADEAGSSFMSLFTTFGTFSIAAGILLIFLIFVMLAAERRGELGIARAIGTRRGHLVQMFTFEGAT